VAISGRFIADFESFYAACTKAEVSLRSFDSGAGKVETSLNKVSDSLSGRKIIQEASLAAEAVERMGGVSKLTQAELQQVGATATEAADKMRALGVDVPPKIQDLADSVKNVSAESGGAVKNVGGLTTSLHAFDNVLAAAGVNIGPEIKALGELGGVSGSTAAQLGVLATAGLTVGSAFAGWKIGRIIADLAGTDKIIGDATANLLGWTTAAGGAGSATDTLARASAIAKREVISFNDAIQIIRDNIKQMQGNAFRLTAIEDSAKELAKWKAELNDLRAGGLLEGLKKDLESQNFSHEQLAKRYGISADALGVLTRQMQAHKEVLDRIQASHEKFIALQDHLFARDVTQKAQEYAQALGGVENASRLIRPVADEVNKTMLLAFDAMTKAGLGATSTAAEFRDLAVATTDWAVINAKLAAMPDPFAAQTKARHDAFRQTLVDQLNLNQGITDSQLYWAHAGEIADASMQKTATAVESVIPPTNEAAAAVSQQFTTAFQSVGSAADAMAAHVASVLGALTQTDAYRKAGFFVNQGFGTADTINKTATRNIGLTIPSYDVGGPVTKDGPIYAHAGEYVVPKGGRTGGTAVTIAAGAIVIQGGGASAGREAADALIAHLNAKGIRT
jgi:hypothetical protein